MPEQDPLYAQTLAERVREAAAQAKAAQSGGNTVPEQVDPVTPAHQFDKTPLTQAVESGKVAQEAPGASPSRDELLGQRTPAAPTVTPPLPPNVHPSELTTSDNRPSFWHRRSTKVGGAILGLVSAGVATGVFLGRGGSHENKTTGNNHPVIATPTRNASQQAPATTSENTPSSIPSGIASSYEGINLPENLAFTPELMTADTADGLFRQWANNYQALFQPGVTPAILEGSSAGPEMVSQQQQEIAKYLFGKPLTDPGLQQILTSVEVYNDYILSIKPSDPVSLKPNLIAMTSTAASSVQLEVSYTSVDTPDIHSGSYSPVNHNAAITFVRSTPAQAGITAPDSGESIWIVSNQQVAPAN